MAWRNESKTHLLRKKGLSRGTAKASLGSPKDDRAPQALMLDVGAQSNRMLEQAR